MKVKSVKANQTEIEFIDGSIVFVSYETPVAYFKPGEGVHKTEYKWSQTTTRHINDFCSRHGLTIKGEKPQQFFDELLSVA